MKWTTYETERLKRFYPNTTKQDLRELFPNRTDAALHQRAMRLDLKKNYSTKFKKGRIPWSKGQKLGYKKGSVPHNAKTNGAITIRFDKRVGRFYSFIRIEKRHWRRLHRVRWEEKHGPIPSDKILRCKTEDTANASPENWELITRQDNAKRNSNIEKSTKTRRRNEAYRQLKKAYGMTI